MEDMCDMWILEFPWCFSRVMTRDQRLGPFLSFSSNDRKLNMACWLKAHWVRWPSQHLPGHTPFFERISPNGSPRFDVFGQSHLFYDSPGKKHMKSATKIVRSQHLNGIPLKYCIHFQSSHHQIWFPWKTTMKSHLSYESPKIINQTHRWTHRISRPMFDLRLSARMWSPTLQPSRPETWCEREGQAP